MPEQIKKISQETLLKLKNKSIKGMAVNPSEKGASAKQIQDAMVDPYIGDNLSLATEVNRIVDEANETFEHGIKADEEIYYENTEPNTEKYKTWIADVEEVVIETLTTSSVQPRGVVRVEQVVEELNVIDNTRNLNSSPAGVVNNTANDNDIIVIDNTR